MGGHTLMTAVAETKPRSWGAVARATGLHDPHARLRAVWQSMNYAEKIIILKSAGLPPETRLQSILSDSQAELIKAAIVRASEWAQRLGV